MDTLKGDKLFKRAVLQKPRWFYGILLPLWIILLGISILLFLKPLRVEEQGTKNNIVQETSFDYKVDIMPSLLYPDGGIIEPKGPIFTNVTKALNLSINTNVMSEKPVIIEGSQQIKYKLIAENLWEYDYYLDDKKEFDIRGTANALIDGNFTLSIKEILDFFDSVQEEINAYPDGYIIKIIPEIIGTIKDGDNEIPIDSSPELIFRLSDQTMELAGEKEFMVETPLGENRMVKNNFYIMGKTMPLGGARIISLILFLLLSLCLAIGLGYRAQLQRNFQTEVDRIIKKYGKRLTYLKDNVDISNRMLLDIKTFEDMIKISDDKDLPILSYDETNEQTLFYVVDGVVIYRYRPQILTEHQMYTMAIGSELFDVR